jgi:hypothetical protein
LHFYIRSQSGMNIPVDPLRVYQNGKAGRGDIHTNAIICFYRKRHADAPSEHSRCTAYGKTLSYRLSCTVQAVRGTTEARGLARRAPP